MLAAVSFQGCFTLTAVQTGRENRQNSRLNLRCNRGLTIPAKFFCNFCSASDDSRLPELLISIANVRRNSIKNEAAENASLGKRSSSNKDLK